MTHPTEAPMANAIDDVKEWVLVPKVPTEAMLEAFSEASWRKLQDSYSPTPTEHPEDGGGSLGYGYRAMLAVAPAPAPSQHTGWSDEAVEAAARAICWDGLHGYGWRMHSHGEKQKYVDNNWIKSAIPAKAALTAASSIAPATGFEEAAQRLKAAYIAETGSTMWPTDEQFRRILAASSIFPSVAKESGEP